MLQPGQFRWTQPAGSQISNSLDEWIDNYQWLNQDTIDWVSFESLWFIFTFILTDLSFRISGMTSWTRVRLVVLEIDDYC